MFNKLAISIILLYSIFSLELRAQDIIASCTSCTSSEVESAALKSSLHVHSAVVHVVDFENDKINSFRVLHDYEPGFESHEANPIPTPSEYIIATNQVHQVIKDVLAKGGNFDKLNNIITQTVVIPTEIATTASEMKDYASSQEVSNYLRIVLLGSFSQQVSTAWKQLWDKIMFQVEAKFVDGSKATYNLGPFWGSDHPYILVRDSLRDSNGNPIYGGPTGSGSIPIINYGSVYNNGAYNLVYQKCVTTKVSVGGYDYFNTHCWITKTP